MYSEESGSERKSVIVDLRIGDEPRMELYVDARDLQSTYTDASGNKQTYTEEEYSNLLKERVLVSWQRLERALLNLNLKLMRTTRRLFFKRILT